MPLIPRLSSLYRSLLHKNRVEQEFTEEIQAYLEMLIEAQIKAGLKPEEARRAALIELGGMEQVKERREVRRGYFLEPVAGFTLRHAVRGQEDRSSLRWLGCPLALGIGANRLSSVSSRPSISALPYPNPSG